MLVAGETRQAYQETSMAATKFGSNREMKTSGESRDYPAAPIARHSAAGILDFSAGNIFKSTFIWYNELIKKRSLFYADLRIRTFESTLQPGKGV